MFESMLNVIYDNYGILGIQGFLLLFALFKWSSVFNVVWKKIKSLAIRNTSIYSPKAILTAKLDYWINIKIDQIMLRDEGRRKVFRELLKIKLNTIKNKIFDIEKCHDFEKMNKVDLHQYIISSLYDIILISRTSALEAGIPAIILDKYNKWYKDLSEHIIVNAELIIKSPSYTNYDVISSIYLLQVSTLELMIVGAEKTLNELNGDLSGIEYKGIIIGES
jgi:hypothetical protein